MTAVAIDVVSSHPAARSAHAVIDAAQIAIGLAARLNYPLEREPASPDTHARRIVTLLEGVPADIAALYQDNEALKAEKADALDEACRMATTIVDLERRLAIMERLDSRRVAHITELKGR